MIAIANDHTALELKKAVIEVFDELGLPYLDLGTNETARCDYPLAGEAAARAVADGRCELGVVLCGTGVGIGISANKVKGIRCAIVSEPYSALMSRQHNDANMIALGARVVGSELAKMIVRTFLTGQFEGGRHARRVDQIMAIEAGESHP
ncbi:MAG: ribose 5-phosphate isomerase B [Christensenellales bacterium]